MNSLSCAGRDRAFAFNCQTSRRPRAPVAMIRTAGLDYSWRKRLHRTLGRHLLGAGSAAHLGDAEDDRSLAR